MRVRLVCQEMTECRHAFVRTEIITDRSSHRITHEPIYHCIKCGLTNEYDVKEINRNLLGKIENNMSYIYSCTELNGILLHARRTCPLEVSKEIYEEIKQVNPNVTNNELKTLFIVALSKGDPAYYQDLIYEIRKLAGLDALEDAEILQRIGLRKMNIPVVTNGISCYELSDFNKDIFEFVRIIEQKAGVYFTSIGDIAKYPNLVSAELSLLKQQERDARFDVIAIPNTRAFVVTLEKLEEFKNYKPNQDIRRRNQEIVQKFKINNLGQSGEPKKKIRKPE